MDSQNYVGQTGEGYIVVVNGTPVGPFAFQPDAEDAFNRLTGQASPSAPNLNPKPITLDCSQGQGAPVNGGCWRRIWSNGTCTWDTNPAYCGDGPQPAPQPGAPSAPESGPIPGMAAVLIPSAQVYQTATDARPPPHVSALFLGLAVASAVVVLSGKP